MDPPKHKRKRRKRSHNHNKSEGDATRHSSGQTAASHSRGHKDRPQKKNLSPIDKQKRHEEALALSQQLRQLSSQKRLKECIDMYHSPTYDELRDAHHGSIVVDCCARCGDVEAAEKIVNGMLQSRKSSKNEPCQYFWEGYKHFSYKQVPIQAWTALLKGYVHSGMMAKADSLFQYLCAVQTSDGGNKQRKRKSGADNGLNVRTLNTLLRGCLWTATSLNSDGINSMAGKQDGSNEVLRNELVGGVMTAEQAWSLCDGSVRFDSSSYEYFISILSQSLQCKRAEDCLQKMRSEFGIQIDNLGVTDPTLIESVVVSLVVIARGYLLLGEMSDTMRCAEEALRYLDASAAGKHESTDSSSKDAIASTTRQTTGGKKAWKDSRGGSNLRDDGNSNGRREESNKLFRNHRQSELRSEALSLQDHCSQHSSPPSKQGKQANGIPNANASHIAQFLLTRLLYFSGGGTTGKDATKATISSANTNVEKDIQQWVHSLWHSFGLKETVQCLLDNKEENNALKSLFHPALSKKQSKKNMHPMLPSKLSPEVCGLLRTYFVRENNAISSDGRIDFKELFSSTHADTAAPQNSKEKSLHIELGAGSGDWAALQAKLNPIENYVTVELRADRVAQTFAKCLLHQDTAGKSKNAQLRNLCCVGSECGSFLRDRVQTGSVSTIFVNHPEPPTQTYDAATNNITTGTGAEEPAHMLNSQIIISAARCLEPKGKGRLIIVTDNVIYARLICRTMIRVLEEDTKLVGLSPGEVRDLRRIESFGQSSIHIYEGKPSLSIGHYTPKKFEGGTSYFDRLWRTGAGKHADMRKRFIIAVRTSGGDAVSYGSKGVRKTFGATPSGVNKQSPKPDGEEKKPNKKRSTEKQKRRNERRLLKNQELAQTAK